MNKLFASISSITEHDSLFLIELDAGGLTLAMLLFDLHPLFSIGCQVSVLFKETEVLLAKGLQGAISIRNRFPATVTNINKGGILATVTLQSAAGELSSIVTMYALKELALNVGDEVTVLLKASQISLEVCHGDF